MCNKQGYPWIKENNFTSKKIIDETDFKISIIVIKEMFLFHIFIKYSNKKNERNSIYREKL